MNMKNLSKIIITTILIILATSCWERGQDNQPPDYEDNRFYWLTDFTTDGAEPITCLDKYRWSLAVGVKCTGRYCDNVQLRCDTNYVPNSTTRYWADWISDDYDSGERKCREFYAVTGWKCKNKYCDDISLQCAYIGEKQKNCRWSGWFSEEDKEIRIPGGFFIAGILCSGKYCDNKMLYYCEY